MNQQVVSEGVPRTLVERQREQHVRCELEAKDPSLDSLTALPQSVARPWLW